MSKQRTGKSAPRSQRSAATRPLAPVPGTPAAPAAPAPRGEDERRAARMARQEMARAAAARRRQRLRLRNIGLGLATVLVISGLIGIAIMAEAGKPGERIAQQLSQPHLNSVNDPHPPYTTNPPTSGQHPTSLPAWGVSTTQVSNELQVHALEDGGVVINYQPTLDAATVDKLKALINLYNDRLLVMPNSTISDPIVLTAWTRMQKFSQYDEAALQRFIDAYRGIDHHKDSGS